MFAVEPPATKGTVSPVGVTVEAGADDDCDEEVDEQPASTIPMHTSAPHPRARILVCDMAPSPGRPRPPEADGAVILGEWGAEVRHVEAGPEMPGQGSARVPSHTREASAGEPSRRVPGCCLSMWPMSPL